MRTDRQRLEQDGMCPNCVTPWKCNGPHWLTEEHIDDSDICEDCNERHAGACES